MTAGDHDFERRMLLAHLRWNLVSAAHTIVADLRSDGIESDAVNLESALILRVANTKPRSAIVPWHLPDEIVVRMIGIVAAEMGERKAG